MIFGQGGICGLMVLNGPIQARRTYYAVTCVMLTQFIPRKVLHANDASLVFQCFDLWTWCDAVCCWNIWHHCVVAKKGQNFRKVEYQCCQLVPFTYAVLPTLKYLFMPFLFQNSSSTFMMSVLELTWQSPKGLTDKSGTVILDSMRSSSASASPSVKDGCGSSEADNSATFMA